MGGILSARPQRFGNDGKKEGREFEPHFYTQQTTNNGNLFDDFAESLEPHLAKAFKAIQCKQFNLNTAKRLVLVLKQLGQKYGEGGRIEKNMVKTVVTRALKDVGCLTQNGKTEAHDPRLTLKLVYLYCVMAAFPNSVHLERGPEKGCVPPYKSLTWYAYDEQCEAKLKTTTRQCFKNGCTTLGDWENLTGNAQLVMDLAAWLELDHNPVVYLITSNTVPCIQKLIEETSNAHEMIPVKEKLETLCEMGLVTCASFLLRGNFVDLANNAFELLKKVNCRRHSPYLASRLAYVKSRVALHRDEYSTALLIASDALIGVTDAEEKRDFEELIEDAQEAFEAAVRQNEICGAADAPHAVQQTDQENVEENTGPDAKKRKRKGKKKTRSKGSSNHQSLPIEDDRNAKKVKSAPGVATETVDRERPVVGKPLNPRKKYSHGASNSPRHDEGDECDDERATTARGAAQATVEKMQTVAAQPVAPKPPNSGRKSRAPRAVTMVNSPRHDRDDNSDDEDWDVSDGDSDVPQMDPYEEDALDDELMTSEVAELAARDDDQDDEDWFSKSETAIDSCNPDEEESDTVQLSEQQKRKFNTESSEKKFYPKLLLFDEAEQLLKSAPVKYKRCQLKIGYAHQSTAKVLDPPYSEILIEGRSKAGQTYMDDEVVVKITATPGRHRGTQQRSDGENSHRAHGQVVGLLNRVNYKDVDHPVLYCTLDDMSGHLMQPLCKTVPKINVLRDGVKRKYPALQKNRIELYKIDAKGDVKHKGFQDILPHRRAQYVFKVVILAWRPQYPYPLGAVLSAHIGGMDYSGGLAVMSMQQKVPKRYPRDTVESTKALCQQTPSRAGREDLTHLRLFTIDPPMTKDIDDAVSIQKKGTSYIIGVHIADVAALVPKGSGVDLEARRRAVSFYPPDRRPRAMLPEPLSHDKCSLLQGQERLAVSIFFTLEETGVQEKRPTIHRTVVKSYKQLTYEEAQKVIDGDINVDVDPLVQEDIRQLHKITSQLKKMRQKNSIFFVPFEDPRLPELKRVTEHLEAHSLIEELMILANSHIASYLTKQPKYGEMMLVRCQQPPTWADLAEWRDTEGSDVTDLVMQLQGKVITPNRVQLSFNANGAAGQRQNVVVQKEVWYKLCQCLERGELTEARRLAFMDSLQPLQCLAAQRWMDLTETAQYRCFAGLNGSEVRHFSLGLDVYTNFTSPIRRYADLYVQRLLHAALDGAKPDSTPEEVTALCKHINSAALRQTAFQKGCLSLKLSETLHNQPLLFRAYVDKANTEQLTLCVPSLLKVPHRKQELPFSVLGVTSQPSVSVNTALRKRTVTVQWSKKIFDVKQTCHASLLSYWKYQERLASGTVVMEIRPDLHSVEVEHDDWAQILQTLVSDSQEPMDEVPHSVDGTKKGVDYMTSEKGDGKVAQRLLKFSKQYTQGDVVQIQMSAEPKKGMLQPRVEVVHTALNASVCTLHVRDPVGVLTRCATRATRNQNFPTYQQYKKAWMPLLEMEAAVCAADNRSGVVINNVKVTMKTQDSPNATGVRYTGSFSLKASFCYERCIDFGGNSTHVISEDEVRKDVSFPLDYLCIRCTLQCSDLIASRVRASGVAETVDKHYTWLAHAAVVKVVHKNRKAEGGGDLVVNFVLSPSSPDPPAKLTKKDGASVTVEILPKTDSERRVQERLLDLEQPECELAQALAYGDSIPVLDAAHVALGRMGSNHEVITRDSSSFPDSKKLPRNNPAQLRAIQMAMTNSLTIIQGPPGSGKTNTGIKLVYLFTKVNRQLEAEGKGKRTVLYCGPSNKAVDHVARELKSKLGSSCPKVVRVYGSAVESKDYPIPKGDLKTVTTRNKCDPALKDIALHHVIRQEGKPHAQDIAAFDKLFVKCRTEPDAVTTKQLKEYHKLLYKAGAEELKQYDVILATCSKGGSKRLTESISSNCSVFQVIIDECAMSPEPHSMVPIIATKAKQVVLIGDHKQLRPIIKCQPAAELGLDQSLFERLDRKFPDYTVFLDTQYRMHPEICAFPSREFYQEKLHTACSSSWGGELPSFWPKHPLSGDPIPHLLINVKGLETALTVTTDQGNENSRSNATEADKAIEILTFLKGEYNVDPHRVKLLTQYNAQRSLLEDKALKAITENRGVFQECDKHRINCSTVVSSQGGEWDYVILTTVSSIPSYLIEPNPTHGWCRQTLGFITDRNQVNVALTRARRGLFIIGNVELLQCDEVWKKLVDRYRQLGCVVDDTRRFPPPMTRRPRRH